MVKNFFRLILLEPTNIAYPKRTAAEIPVKAPIKLLFVETKLAACRKITVSIPSLKTATKINENNPNLCASVSSVGSHSML